MAVIHLPTGTKYVQLDDLAELMADALYPCTGEDDERVDYGIAWLRLESELARAVKSGGLPVRDSMTKGPHPYPEGNALKSALVSVDDLREFVADRNIDVITAPAQNTATPAPVVAGGKKWTPEKLAELKAYREAHTMPETAQQFGISEQRIRDLLPSSKPKAKPFAGLIHRMK